MDKYKELENKLIKIRMHIDKMNIKSEPALKRLIKYKDYVDKLIYFTHNKDIDGSCGGGLGLIQGISDYDELCSDHEFVDLVADADVYYSEECVIFDD